MGTSSTPTGWVRRPVVAGIVRASMVLGPFVAGWIAIRVLGRFFFAVEGWLGFGLWVVQALVVAVVVGRLVSRFAERLTPLHFLLGMTLVFPDQAPPRFRVALRSGTVKRLLETEGASVGSIAQGGAADAVALVTVLRDHDPLTRGHTERVRAYAEMMGAELGLSDDDLNKLRWGVLLHDVGKLEVPTEILNKPARPSAEEWEILRRHPGRGGEIVLPLEPWLGDWSLAAAQHHERWDGTGYPLGIAGSDISLAGRVAAVADAYDVVTSRRSYKEPMSADKARQELVDGAGTQFDPDIVRVMLQCGLKRPASIGAFGWLMEVPVAARIASSIASIPAAATAAAVAAVAVASGAAPVIAADPQGSAPVSTDVAEVASTTATTDPVDIAAPTTTVVSRLATTTTVGPATTSTVLTTSEVPVTVAEVPASTTVAPSTAVPTTAAPTTAAPVITPPVTTSTTTTIASTTTTTTTTTTTSTTTTIASTTTTTVPVAVANCIAMADGQTNLGGADLTGCDFAGMTIDGLNLAGADLSGADLAGVSVSNFNVAGADLSDADLSGAVFTDGSMHSANLAGADLTDVVIERTDFAYLDATGVDFSGGSFVDASFGFALLDDAEFDRATFTGVNFNDASIVRASFINASLAGSEWLRADAQEADFTGADLGEGVFTSSDLRRALFTDATLDRAVLDASDLTNADLTRASLLGATGVPSAAVATFDATVCPNGTVRSDTCW